jgi:hypothetical protein
MNSSLPADQTHLYPSSPSKAADLLAGALSSSTAISQLMFLPHRLEAVLMLLPSLKQRQRMGLSK